MKKFFDSNIEIASKAIKEEGEAILNLISFLNEDFSNTIEVLHQMKGRLIVTGIGKSAIIGQKIVATFNSTGTPAIFMHAADAIHGDLGIIQKDDVVLCISKSGNTPEIKVLVPLILNRKNTLIAMVSNPDSVLARNADYILRASVEKEVCPNNLAPTTSTTAQLVLGDALAVCLLEKKGFTKEDFAKVHPGGALGKQLYLKVEDLYQNNEKPSVKADANWSEIIYEISSKRLGATAVTDENNHLLGIITDGDIRRCLEKGEMNLTAEELMSKNPKSVLSSDLAVNVYQLMKKNKITQVAIINENKEYLGIVHIHDLLKEGIV